MASSAPVPKPKLFQAKELTSVCVVNAEGRAANLVNVSARGLPKVQKLPERTAPLAIVASGPSVRELFDEIYEWPINGEIWAINGAYDFLLDNGIIPEGFFSIDPLPQLTEYLGNAQRETTFYLSATSDPATFDALTNFKVQTFLPDSPDLELPQDWVIGGGTTSLTRVPFLALLQGWRDITIFGCDSSFNGTQYCYEWGRYSTDINTKKLLIEVNPGEVFETELGLMKQCSQLAVIHSRFKGMLKFRCNGLLTAFMRSPMFDQDVIEVVDNDGHDADSDEA